MCSATWEGNSAVNGLPIGLILIPVNSSHIGPENFEGSSSWRASSQTTLRVMPENCLAASTAASAEFPVCCSTAFAADTDFGLNPVKGATIAPTAAAAA